MADDVKPKDDVEEDAKNLEAIEWHERTEQTPRGGHHDREDDERMTEPPPPFPN